MKVHLLLNFVSYKMLEFCVTIHIGYNSIRRKFYRRRALMLS
jgi:hypothetical protein